MEMENLINIPAKLSKVSADRKFLGADKHRIMDVGCDLAGTVTARYYKGLSAHGDNLVIIMVNDE